MVTVVHTVIVTGGGVEDVYGPTVSHLWDGRQTVDTIKTTLSSWVSPENDDSVDPFHRGPFMLSDEQ
ncbi:hypothetical protein [Haladaptatus caseinilyticus]|uniref:hypothetical protein n=1 Tax=Haladaptatus caseinilyticus TaxID=2993314 RepID=UPI00224B1942|nr:hypothetical protein [Haladaptatus caseinilyticus]